MEKRKPDSLFICFTPLHALIADQIIRQEKIRGYILVYFYNADNNKNRAYFSLIAREADRALYVHKTNSITDFIIRLPSLILSLRGSLAANATVYSGNIKTLYSRWVIAFLRIPHVRTFDDGFGTVNPNGYFSEGLEPRLLTRIDRALRLNVSYYNIYNRIEKHYTIYRLPNVMPNPVYIPVFDTPEFAAGTQGDAVTVLLSSTLSEERVLLPEKEHELYSRVISELDVKYVIPHPLDKSDKFAGLPVEVISSEKIAEEIVFDLRKRFSRVRVVGWFSSALLNLSNVDGVEVMTISFDDALLQSGVRDLFDACGVRIYKPEGFVA